MLVLRDLFRHGPWLGRNVIRVLGRAALGQERCVRLTAMPISPPGGHSYWCMHQLFPDAPYLGQEARMAQQNEILSLGPVPVCPSSVSHTWAVNVAFSLQHHSRSVHQFLVLEQTGVVPFTPPPDSQEVPVAGSRRHSPFLQAEP